MKKIRRKIITILISMVLIMVEIVPRGIVAVAGDTSMEASHLNSKLAVTEYKSENSEAENSIPEIETVKESGTLEEESSFIEIANTSTFIEETEEESSFIEAASTSTYTEETETREESSFIEITSTLIFTEETEVGEEESSFIEAASTSMYTEETGTENENYITTEEILTKSEEEKQATEIEMIEEIEESTDEVKVEQGAILEEYQLTGTDYTLNYREENGGICITGIKIQADLNNLIIPSKIDGKAVVKIDDYAFYEKKEIKGDLTIPDSVKEIGEKAFYNCDGLTGRLSIGSNVTKIGDYAFSFCGFTGALMIPDSVIMIGTDAFSFCSFTGDLKIPNSITKIEEGAFSYCEFTGKLEIPKSVTMIEKNAFYSNRFEVIDIPANVQEIGDGAFANNNDDGGKKITVYGNDVKLGLDSLGKFNFIYGYRNSTVEKYVEDKIGVYGNCKFIPLDESLPQIQQYRVSTKAELVNALGSYRHIILADGIYDCNLLINNVESLSIEAEHPGKVEFLYSTKKAMVDINFSTGIKISGCIIGHGGVDFNDCGGNSYVVEIKNSFGVEIEGCDLYGCGVWGVVTQSSNDIFINNSVIRDCKLGVSKGNGTIRFSNCIVSGNAYDDSWRTENCPAVMRSGKAFFENCMLINNYNTAFYDENVFDLNCTYYNNVWDSGVPKDYGICLNGITWQVEGETLKLGYPLHLNSETIKHSKKGRVLDYSSYSMPWGRYCLSKIDVAEGIEYQETDIIEGTYKNIIWSIDKFGKLTVKGSGDFVQSEGYSYNVPWYNYKDKIRVAEINVTGVKRAGYAFSGCSNLLKADLSGMDISDVTSLKRMFANCYSLKELDLTYFNTGSVTDMSGMFMNCSSLQKLDLSSFDTGKVKDMDSMFSGCVGLTSLDLRNWNNGSVTIMNRMFSGCNRLNELKLSGFNTNNVTGMWSMFEGCSELTELDLSGFKTANVKDMKRIFYGCSNLISLDLSSFDLSNVTSEEMFSNNDCLSFIMTPYNNNQSIALPYSEVEDKWYQPDGDVITELPKNLSYSIVIQKNVVPDVSCIKIEKIKTEYMCGDNINIDDLTVSYYNDKGTLIKVNDYTTNANIIDTSTPGTKILRITYNGMTATVELKFTYAFNENTVNVTLPDQDFIYNGREQEPVPTVSIGSKVLFKDKDYILSYDNNINAGSNAKIVITGQKDYKGRLVVPFNIKKATVTEEKNITEYVSSCDEAHSGRMIDIVQYFKEYGEITECEVKKCTENDQINGNVFADVPTIKDGILTYNTNAGKCGDYADVTIEVSFDNYESTFIIVTIMLTDKENLIISGISVRDSIYTGQGVSYSGIVSAIDQNGRDVADKVNFSYVYSGMQADKTSYAESAKPPVNAGEYIFKVTVSPDNSEYTGSVEYNFKILKAPVIIKALDVNLTAGEPIPAIYKFDTTGLLNGDSLIVEPSFDCDVQDTEKVGVYNIIPHDADAGMNYAITYYKGTLKISESSIDNPPQENIPDGIWIADIEDCVYTGKAITPSVKVYYNKKRLMAGRDYTITYQNNIKAAMSDSKKAPAVIVKGKGNYTGKRKAFFTIKKRMLIEKDNIKVAKIYPQDIKYTPVVTCDNNVLKAGTDYTLMYLDASGSKLKSQPTKTGSYQMHIHGKGSCEGDIYFRYSISERGGAKLINKGTATISSFIYGSNKPEVSLSVDGIKLTCGTEYFVNFDNVDRKGVATATFIGVGNYTGILKKKFNVLAAPIQESDISIPKTVAYEKGGAKAEVTVTVNGNKLVRNTDYTVLYKNNTKVGNIAEVIVKGKGNYSGNVTKTFHVEAQMLTAEGIKIYVSDAQAKRIPLITVYDINGKKMSAKSDYSAIIDKAGHKVTITGGKNGLYKVMKPIVISYRELAKGQQVTSVVLNKRAVTVPKYFEYSGKDVMLEKDWLIVKAGKTILNSNEFEIIGYVNNIQKGTATVIIQGSGEFGGIKMLKYKIKTKGL